MIRAWLNRQGERVECLVRGKGEEEGKINRIIYLLSLSTNADS